MGIKVFVDDFILEIIIVIFWSDFDFF